MPNDHTLTGLRDHLFGTLAALRDKANPMDIDRAKAVCAVAKEITDTARVEVAYQQLTGNAGGSNFLEALPAPGTQTKPGGREATAHGIRTVTALPGGTVTSHKMR